MMTESVAFSLGAANWGTVPDWFAAVGTIGALFTTITLILRDRRKESRSLVDLISVSPTLFEDYGTPISVKTLSIEFSNHGPMPIQSIIVFSAPGTSKSSSKMSEASPLFIRAVPDEESLSELVTSKSFTLPNLASGQAITLPITVPRLPKLDEYYLAIQDARGKTWYRNIATSRYLTKRKGKYLYNKAQPEWLRSD